MSQPFIGEIRPFGFNFAPRNWALCNGQVLPISQNTALFSLLGTYYGGNGTSTFQLPNLQSRVAVHQGQGPGLSQYALGEIIGTEYVTLLSTELPAHSHLVNCNNTGGTQASPQNNFPAVESSGMSLNYNSASNAQMNPAIVGFAGGNQPHNNLQPYLTINFCICMAGVFPSRN